MGDPFTAFRAWGEPAASPPKPGGAVGRSSGDPVFIGAEPRHHDRPFVGQGGERPRAGRYFEYRDGTPFLWMGDTWWNWTKPGIQFSSFQIYLRYGGRLKVGLQPSAASSLFDYI